MRVDSDVADFLVDLIPIARYNHHCPMIWRWWFSKSRTI